MADEEHSEQGAAGKIFINYRRDDDPGNTGRLFDRLHEAFKYDWVLKPVIAYPSVERLIQVSEDKIVRLAEENR